MHFRLTSRGSWGVCQSELKDQKISRSRGRTTGWGRWGAGLRPAPTCIRARELSADGVRVAHRDRIDPVVRRRCLTLSKPPSKGAGPCAHKQNCCSICKAGAGVQVVKDVKARSFGGSTYLATTATRLLPSGGFSTTLPNVATRRPRWVPTPMTSGICSSFWLLRDWSGRRFDQPMRYGSCLFCGGGRANAQHSDWGSV